MSAEVSFRELDNQTAQVLRRVEADERPTSATVDGRPLAELVPLPARTNVVRV